MLHDTKVTTLERFILDQERAHPEATGELTNLLYDIALAAKIIAAQIRRAGLVNIIGKANVVNVQGEEQQKLDIFANETMKHALNRTGRICAMASEEDEEIIPIPGDVTPGKYVVLFDPLDDESLHLVVGEAPAPLIIGPVLVDADELPLPRRVVHHGHQLQHGLIHQRTEHVQRTAITDFAA